MICSGQRLEHNTSPNVVTYAVPVLSDTVKVLLNIQTNFSKSQSCLTVAPMRGIYLHLKNVLQCIRLFYIKKINDDAFHVLTFHFSLTLALRLSFFFSKYKISVRSITLVPILWAAHGTFTSGPSGRAGRLWAALSDHGRHRDFLRAHCRASAHLPSG